MESRERWAQLKGSEDAGHSPEPQLQMCLKPPLCVTNDAAAVFTAGSPKMAQNAHEPWNVVCPTS